MENRPRHRGGDCSVRHSGRRHFQFDATSGDNDMNCLLPPPRANARKMPPNPYAAQIKADGGKGGKH